MDISKFTMGIVGLVVIILLITSVVLPAVSNAQEDQRSTANNTDILYSLADSNILDVEKVYDDDNTVIGVSFNDYVLSYTSTSSRIVVVASDFLFEFYSNSNVQIIGLDSETNESYYVGFKSVHVEDGIVTITASNNAVTTHSTATDFIYVVSENGDYCEASMSSGLNVDPDARILFCSDLYLSATGQENKRVRIISSGTVDEQVVSMLVNVPKEGTTPTLVPTVSEVEGQPYLSVKGNVQVSAVYVVDEADVTFTYNNTGVRVIAPVEYTIISDNDSMIISLMAIIPLLLIIVAVLYAVRLMGSSRN